MAAPTARFVTFGCKVNQYDTQVLRERLLAAGYVESESDPDVVVVNTCTVTVHGGASARKAVRRLARENPGAAIYLTGCYAQNDPEVVAELPGVRGVFGTGDREGLLRVLGAEPSESAFIEERVAGLAKRSRAFVKVQDGCIQGCTYCIVPHVRPEVTSKRPETVVAEVRELCARGHREVVLTGVHLGFYGTDGTPGAASAPLTDLVARLLAETDVERLRLSSIEATEITDALLDLVAGTGRVAPHLHLPIQSGSDPVLRAMGRPYDAAEFQAVVARVRDRIPLCALSTDLIVGFPGERAEDFERSLSAMRAAGFVKTHVFPYSPRPGTPAAGMEGPVHAKEIRRRADEAGRLGATLAREFAELLRGREETALVLGERSAGMLTGIIGRCLRVLIPGPGTLAGMMVPVRMGEWSPDGVEAERMPE